MIGVNIDEFGNEVEESKVCNKCGVEKELSEFKFRTDTQKYRNECKQCRTEYNIKYWENNKEKLAEYSKEYREDNKENIKKQSKKYYKNNKQKQKEYHKEYYENNRETILKKQKEYYIKNIENIKIYNVNSKERRKEHRKLYYENNREKFIDYRETHKEQRINCRLLHKYGITLDKYNRMVENQKGVCYICSKPQKHKTNKLFIDHDHVTGKVRGLLCHACNIGLGHYEVIDNSKVEEYLKA